MKTITQEQANKQTINFFRFINNFNFGDVERMLNECTTCGEHLISKWNSYCISEGNNGSKGLLRLFGQLDSENQTSVLNWINNNYKG